MSATVPPSDIDIHMTYAAQQRLDGYAEAVHHAVRRKAVFDRRVTKSKAGIVEFQKGQLVQVYRNKLALTLGTERKLAPMWSPPHRVAEHLLNSYRLETLQGTPLDGLFNARHLRSFTPREGTELATQQKKFEDELASWEAGAVEPDEVEVTEPGEGEEERIANEERIADEDLELGLESSEWEIQDVGGDSGAGFFYDEGEDQEEEDIGIGARVAARRRGRLHSGGGQME